MLTTEDYPILWFHFTAKIHIFAWKTIWNFNKTKYSRNVDLMLILDYCHIIIPELLSIEILQGYHTRENKKSRKEKLVLQFDLDLLTFYPFFADRQDNTVPPHRLASRSPPTDSRCFHTRLPLIPLSMCRTCKGWCGSSARLLLWRHWEPHSFLGLDRPPKQSRRLDRAEIMEEVSSRAWSSSEKCHVIICVNEYHLL